MLHQVGVSFDLYYDARKHKIKKNIYFSIKYIKSVLWRIAEHLSYIEDAWRLKVNVSNGGKGTRSSEVEVNSQQNH